MQVLNAILKIIFPTKCISCKKQGEYLCEECLNKCQICQKENLDWVFSVYDYKDSNIKKIVKLLKYKNKKDLSKIIGNSIYNVMLEELSELNLLENFTNPILIPIPLSKKRLRERGFNQAELIAKEIQKNNPSYFELKTKILIKNKDTKHQADIKDKKERLKNLIDSFDIKNKEEISKRNIILIDDVTTTGATLNEAKKILKRNGAKKIIAFTFAH